MSTANFPTLREGNLSRPYLLPVLAKVIANVYHGVRPEGVTGNTPTDYRVAAAFATELKRLKLISTDFQFQVVATADELISQVVRE